MKAMAYKYNEDFISNIRAEDIVQRYLGYVNAIAWATSDSTLYYDSRQRMEDASSRLIKELPKLPSRFTLSYFVGVAASVDDPRRGGSTPTAGRAYLVALSYSTPDTVTTSMGCGCFHFNDPLCKDRERAYSITSE
ncbi:hypothetical protein NHJ13051_006911 [Beauveria bassiana]